MAVLIVVAKQRLKHGSWFPQYRDVYCVVGHEAAYLTAVKPQVIGDDVWGCCMRVNEAAAERPRVAELVGTRGNRKRHGEVVAFSKAEKDVLHSGAGRFVCL